MDESPGRFPPPPPNWGPPQPQSFYPLDMGRIVQLTFSLFRFRLSTFIAIALAIQVPIALATGLVQAYTVEAVAFSTQDMFQAVIRGETSASALLRLIPWNALILTWVVSPVLAFAAYVGVAALTHAAAATFAGGPVSAGRSIGDALRRLRPLAVAFLIPFLVTIVVALVGGSIAATLFIAGALQPGLLVFLAVLVIVAVVATLLFFAVRWSLAAAVVMIENSGGASALGRSWRLVAGSSWRVLGYILLFAVLVGLPLAMLGFLVTAVVGSGVEQTAIGLVADPWEAFMSTFLLGLLSALFAPIAAIAMTVLYFDIRSRHGEKVPVPGQPAEPAARGETGP